jgi:hypothetical protein
MWNYGAVVAAALAEQVMARAVVAAEALMPN